MLRHAVKKSALSAQLGATRNLQSKLANYSNKLDSYGLEIHFKNLQNLRNRRIVYQQIDLRCLASMPTPALKNDENKEEDQKGNNNFIESNNSNLPSSTIVSSPTHIVPKEKTEIKMTKPEFLNLADIRSKESLWTKTMRIIEGLPKAIFNGSKAFTLWFAQFSREFISNPRKKLKEISHILKEGASHYWVGSKLLVADVKIASAILGRATTGSKLTRREQKQLVRTASDLARLVPMSVFVLIPFMELLLPVALKLFPNMLPSTFEDSLQKEDSMKRELQMRLAMADFMKDMLREMAKDVQKKKKGNASDGSSAAEVTEFVDKAKLGSMKNEDILKFAKLFKDDLTLDNMSRTQLVTMCTFMNLPIYGADAFIRFKLRSHIRDIQNDDQRILFEGIDSLNRTELQEACRERGMRALGLSKEQLTKQLQQWLDLSCHHQVPISLLILSRSFALTQGEEALEKAIGQSISALDEGIVTAVVLEAATPEERKSKEIRSLKLEAYEHQADLIAGEKEDREKVEKLALEKALKNVAETMVQADTTEDATMTEDIARITGGLGEIDALKSKDMEMPPPSTKMNEDEVVQMKELMNEMEMKDTLSIMTTPTPSTSSSSSSSSSTSPSSSSPSSSSPPSSSSSSSSSPASTTASPTSTDEKDSEKELEMYLESVQMIKDTYQTPKEESTVMADKQLKSLGLTPQELAALDVFVSVSAVDREKDYVERIRLAVADVVDSMKQEEIAAAAEAEQLEVEVEGPAPMSTTEFKEEDTKEKLEMAEEVDDILKNELSSSSSSSSSSNFQESKEAMTIVDESNNQEEEVSQEKTLFSTIHPEDISEKTFTEIEAEEKRMFVEISDGKVSSEVLPKEIDVVDAELNEEERSKDESSQETATTIITPLDDDDEEEEEDAVSSKISSFLHKTLEKLDADIAKVDEYIGKKLHVLDLDQDGLLSEEELTTVLQTMFKYKLSEDEAKAKVRKLMDSVDADYDGVVSVDELRNWLKIQARKKEVEVHESSLEEALKENELEALAAAMKQIDEKEQNEEPKVHVPAKKDSSSDSENSNTNIS